MNPRRQANRDLRHGRSKDLVERGGVEGVERALEAAEVGVERLGAAAQRVLLGGAGGDEGRGRLPQLPRRLGRGGRRRLEAARVAVA